MQGAHQDWGSRLPIRQLQASQPHVPRRRSNLWHACPSRAFGLRHVAAPRTPPPRLPGLRRRGGRGTLLATSDGLLWASHGATHGVGLDVKPLFPKP